MSTDEELAEAMAEVDDLVRRHDDIPDPVPLPAREPFAHRLRSWSAKHDMLLTMLGAGAVGLLDPLGLPIWAVAAAAVGIGWSLALWANGVRGERQPAPTAKPKHPPRGSMAVPQKLPPGTFLSPEAIIKAVKGEPFDTGRLLALQAMLSGRQRFTVEEARRVLMAFAFDDGRASALELLRDLIADVENWHRLASTFSFESGRAVAWELLPVRGVGLQAKTLVQLVNDAKQAAPGNVELQQIDAKAVEQRDRLAVIRASKEAR